MKQQNLVPNQIESIVDKKFSFTSKRISLFDMVENTVAKRRKWL